MRALALALLILPFVSYGQERCRVLDPELQGFYEGPCVDGLAEGTGHAKGRAEYRGEFKAGRKHGRGAKTWPNGDGYEGAFVEDRKEGRGVYVFGRGPWAGERYEGEFANDRRHGQGVYRWPSGDVYSGPWENDSPTGPLTEMMLARAIYERNARAAVSRPGRKVCREMEVGIGTRDWLRGTVTAVEGASVVIRIDDAGRHPHVLAGTEVRSGELLRDSPLAWTPCW